MFDNYINPEKYSGVAKEETLNSAKEEILTAVENIKLEVDLSDVENIKLEVDLSDVAKESTLTEIKGVLAEIKAATEVIGVISNEDIDALFEE